MAASGRRHRRARHRRVVHRHYFFVRPRRRAAGGVNWIYYAALTMLSGDYASATNDIQRAAYVAAANYPSAVIASPLALAYAIGTLSFGILIIGFLMLKGIFSKVGHGCGRRLEHSSDSECGLRDSLALFCGLQILPARLRFLQRQVQLSVRS